MKTQRLARLGTKLAAGIGALTVAATVNVGSAHAAIIDFLPNDPTKIGKDDIIHVLTNIIQWGLAFASAIGVIFIVINGYQYILSAGNPEQIEKAKMGLTWSIGGFVLAISSYAIVLLTAQTLGFQQIGALKSNQPGSLPGSADNILVSIANILFIFGGAVAVAFIILGGYRYVTSQGNRDAVEKAKQTLLYAVVGLLLLFSSVVIFNLIANQLQVK